MVLSSGHKLQLLVAVGEKVEHEGHDLGEVPVHLLLPMLCLQVPAVQQICKQSDFIRYFCCSVDVLLIDVLLR